MVLTKLEPWSNNVGIDHLNSFWDAIGSGVKLISPMAFGTINRLADRGRRGCSISPTTFLNLSLDPPANLQACVVANKSCATGWSGVKRLCDVYSRENNNYISWPSCKQQAWALVRDLVWMKNAKVKKFQLWPGIKLSKTCKPRIIILKTWCGRT